MNKKIILAFSVFIFLLLLIPVPVSSKAIPSPVQGDFLDNFNRLTSAIKPITTLLFLGVSIFGGWLWMYAGDNPERLSKARYTLLAGIGGLIIVFLAPSLVDFIGIIFGVNDLIAFPT